MDYTGEYNQNEIPNEYRLMSPWATIGYSLLFCIPLVGFILLIIFAFDDSFIARRNYARSYFCSLLVFVPLIIILAFIVLSTGGSTTNKAQLAVFTNNFSQYYDRVTMDALNAKQTLGIRSENVNDAQLYYMVANGLRTAVNDCETVNRTLPVGYVLPDTIEKIYRRSDDDIVAYVIDDNNITGYNARPNDPDGSAGYEFYGDTNGEEYHFITSTGHVFTLPGYPHALDDGTIMYYISNEKGCYYVTKGNSKKSVGQHNVYDDIITEDNPINAKEIMNNLYGLTADETPVSKYHDQNTGRLPSQETDLNDEVGTKVGRYTIIK